MRKYNVFWFNLWATLKFSDPKMPTQSLLYQNNLSNRTNQPEQKQQLCVLENRKFYKEITD